MATKYARTYSDFGDEPPVSGLWPAAWKRYRTTPVAGQSIGWVCVEAGTPGLWKEFGEVGLVDAATHSDTGTAPPAGGTWPLGWQRFNEEPVAGGNLGWLCVEAGTPGTWVEFGLVSL